MDKADEKNNSIQELTALRDMMQGVASTILDNTNSEHRSSAHRETPREALSKDNLNTGKLDTRKHGV